MQSSDYIFTSRILVCTHPRCPERSFNYSQGEVNGIMVVSRKPGRFIITAGFTTQAEFLQVKIKH